MPPSRSFFDGISSSRKSALWAEIGAHSQATFYDRELNRRAQFDVEPVLPLGGRFQFGRVGVIARVGWPMMSVGVNFQS